MEVRKEGKKDRLKEGIKKERRKKWRRKQRMDTIMLNSMMKECKTITFLCINITLSSLSLRRSEIGCKC